MGIRRCCEHPFNRDADLSLFWPPFCFPVAAFTYLNIYFQITNSFQHIITMETAVLQQKSIAWSDMRPKSASTDHTEETYGFRPSKPRPK
jgi:hypothetical protein